MTASICDKNSPSEYNFQQLDSPDTEHVSDERKVNTSWRSRLRRDIKFRRKVFRSTWMCLAFFALGVGNGIRGPSFIDLQLITNTNVQQASAYFTAGSAGYVAGSTLSGFVYDLLSKSMLLIVNLVCWAVLLAATPYCRFYWLMIAVSFLAACFSGGIDTVANADILRTWEGEGNAALQAIHFTFAVGGVVAPLITEPFLAPTPSLANQSHDTTTHTAALLINGEVANGSGMVSDLGLAEKHHDQSPVTSSQTRVHYAYIITALLTLLSTVPFIVQYVSKRRKMQGHCRKNKKSDEDAKKTKTKGDENSTRMQLPRSLYLGMLAWACLFYMQYTAVEDTFGAYLTYYVVNQLYWTKSQGALLTSAYFISFAMSRLGCIFLARLLSPVKLLMICFVLLVVSLSGFLLSSLLQLHWGVWVSSVVIGPAMSAVFPGGLSWMDAELLPITGRVMSAVMLASSLGPVANPLVLGHLMENYDAIWLAYVLLAEGVLCVLTFVLLLLFSRFCLQRRYAPGKGQEVNISVDAAKTGPVPQHLQPILTPQDVSNEAEC